MLACRFASLYVEINIQFYIGSDHEITNSDFSSLKFYL